MQVKATARYVRVAPNKVRQVVAHIRGLPVEEARRVLTFSPKGAAQPILKTLNSAVANAENNADLDADDLFVAAATVDEGPTLKRYQPRAMGRAYRIRKRTSHIAITLGVRERVAATPARPSRRRRKRDDQTEAASTASASKQGPGSDAAGEKE
jgi:large subunit ribosomal protein L22